MNIGFNKITFFRISNHFSIRHTDVRTLFASSWCEHLHVSPLCQFVYALRDSSSSAAVTFVFRSESLIAESRSVQSSPSYRLMKSRSESDLSQPESDEEGYTLVQHTRTHTPVGSLTCITRSELVKK